MTTDGKFIFGRTPKHSPFAIELGEAVEPHVLPGYPHNPILSACGPPSWRWSMAPPPDGPSPPCDVMIRCFPRSWA